MGEAAIPKISEMVPGYFWSRTANTAEDRAANERGELSEQRLHQITATTIFESERLAAWPAVGGEWWRERVRSS
jgi:hypothetical protein